MTAARGISRDAKYAGMLSLLLSFAPKESRFKQTQINEHLESTRQHKSTTDKSPHDAKKFPLTLRNLHVTIRGQLKFDDNAEGGILNG